MLWDKNCAKCHGADGKGATKAGKMAGAKDMTDAKWQTDVTDERAFKSVKEGIKEGDKVRMKPAEGVTDDDIKALIAYTRTFKK
jgi:mono/diheme cytochrome c family protein